jgi:hypothetical protein
MNHWLNYTFEIAALAIFLVTVAIALGYAASHPNGYRAHDDQPDQDHTEPMPGRTHGGHITPGRTNVYEALKARMGKTRAAKIANAGKTHTERSRMAKKAARTRKRRGR